jgi:hypothetical protein
MKNWLLFSLFLLTNSLIISQEFPISWGNLERSNGSLIEILPRTNTDFYTLRWSGGRTFGSYRITNHENLSFIQTQRIKQVAENGIANFENAYYFGGKLYVFLSDKKSGEMSLYYQIYDSELKPSGDSELIATYNNNKLNAKPNFKILQSWNREFIGVVWEIPGKRTTSDIYGYKVFNNTMNSIQSGEYVIPFDGNLTSINENHISNQGDYYLSLTEHLRPNDRFMGRASDNFKAIHVYKIRNNELKEFQVDLDGKRVDDITLSSNDSSFFTLSGIYGSGNLSGIEGIFIVRIDSKNDSVVSRGMVPFSRDLVFQNLNERQRDKAEQRLLNRNSEPQLYNYRLRDTYTQPDGSVLGSIEQYYVHRRVTYDNRTGVSSTIYYYYYDDIIAFKIGKSGQFEWQKMIPKSQVSINDGGPFSSYTTFMNDKKMYFIFNDNLKNYNEDGSFSLNMNSNSIYSLNLSKRRNAAAIASIDIETGEITRNTLFTRKELNSIVIPKMFKINLLTHELLMYAILGGKERFGILNFSGK